MTTSDALSLIVPIVMGSFILGWAIGAAFEARWGRAGREWQRYHRIVLRMIPRLKPYYSEEYITNVLMRDKRHDD